MFWQGLRIKKTLLALGPVLVLLIGYFTYFRGYSEPTALFWDENYHIASAQKYLNGIFFMEPHPPLGKLLIAAGEKLLDANPVDNTFIGTDHAQGLPDNFSFAGYRFFSSLLGCLTGLVLYFLFYQITSRAWVATCLSALYLFDNALIVHARSAMLDAPLIFFVCLALCFYQVLYRDLSNGKRLRFLALGFGVASALALATKATGLVLLAFGLVLCFRKARLGGGALVTFLVWSLIPALVIWSAVWQIHFALGRTLNPVLSHKGFYGASAEVKKVLEGARPRHLWDFPILLRDNLRYASQYQRGVPKLNLCKVGELGSPSFLWPFGGRSINYRWETTDDVTRYLYLQANPAGWALGLLGLVLGFGLVVGSALTGAVLKRSYTGEMAAYMFGYIFYMGLISQLGRVMYLYHYFVPLILSWVMFAFVFEAVTNLGRFTVSAKQKNFVLILLISLVMLCFGVFSPLTYSKPISDAAISKLAWLKIWDLRCARCAVKNEFASPVYDPNVKPFPDVAISGLKAENGYQEWGDPKQDLTVTGKKIIVGGKEYQHGLGVHARSNLKFAVRKSVKSFNAFVAMPDALPTQNESGGSVVFEVRGDGRVLWRSVVVKPGTSPISLNLAVEKVENLELVVLDSGDGNTNDHAVWINPEFL